MAEIKELNLDTGENVPTVGDAFAPKGKETPVGVGLQYNADNNRTPEVTPLQQAENQAELNAIANQNQKDSEEYSNVPAKPEEKPVEDKKGSVKFISGIGEGFLTRIKIPV